MRVLQREQRERLRIAGAGPEVAVLVVSGGDRDVQLARARQQLSVGRHDDRRVVAKAIAGVRALIQRCVHVHPAARAIRAAKL